MKRTTVFAAEDDLATIKAAAARRGVPEAEILRDAIHLAAMANRSWDEPFFTHSYSPEGDRSQNGPDKALGTAWDEKAQTYERTRSRSR